MHVFSLFEFLHRWLSECSCTCAGGFNLLADSINQTFEAHSNVRILCHRAKSDPSFLTEWTLFLIFTCSSLKSSLVDFTEVIKRFQLKSVSVINSQLFWWTNYSVMWCCIFTSLFWWRIASTCILFTAFHLLLLFGSLLWIIFFCSNLLSPFSFLQCRSKMRKDLLFWQKFKFLYATPASLSRVVCLRLSKQSSVTARTNFSSQVLVLPAQERFSFKVYVFSKECLILFKGKQNKTLNFYCLHKLLFSENTWNRITLNVVYFQQTARHIFTCKAMHFCGLISKLMVLLYTVYLETSAS